jgi:DNA-binding HxlR family transcriptional regulator
MVATNTAVRASAALNPHAACRAEVVETLALIGDKWTVMVVGALSKGPIRYNEFRRRVEGISQRMLTLTLTLTLKGLEQDGLVTRTGGVSEKGTERPATHAFYRPEIGRVLAANDVSPGLRGSVARAAG